MWSLRVGCGTKHVGGGNRATSRRHSYSPLRIQTVLPGVTCMDHLELCFSSSTQFLELFHRDSSPLSDKLPSSTVLVKRSNAYAIFIRVGCWHGFLVADYVASLFFWISDRL